MKKTATTSYPIHDLLAERWSPRAFSDRPLEREKLGSLLEAARWAPSCFNEQPWTLLVATRDDRAGFNRLASCLMEANSWAKDAPVLILSVAKLTFERNGKPNRHAFHDVGLAMGNLTVQAQSVGLSVHQMAGFDAERAREVLRIPKGFDPVAMIVVGYRAEQDALPEALREREVASRDRKELDSIVFAAAWNEPLGMFPEGA
jgi:nitroreductase